MRRGLPIIMAAALLLSIGAAAWAQNAGAERDPFFPSERKPPLPALSPRDAEWGRDPFTKPFSGPAAGQQPTAVQTAEGLSGIIYSPKVRLAIIRGEAMREGSMVGDRRLVDIRRRSIVLMSSTGEYEEIFLPDFTIRH